MERAPTAPVLGYTGSRRFKDVRVFQLVEYPVRGLVFECGQNLPDMADFVAEVCMRLQEANIPHNLFIVDCGMRVFLYPNGFAAAKAEVGHVWVLRCFFILWHVWVHGIQCGDFNCIVIICPWLHSLTSPVCLDRDIPFFFLWSLQT